ncbi:MAG: response regulator [Candidatus Scatosoma sp.]
MANEKIKVLIADDQTILAEGIKSVLETDETIEVAGIAADGADALEKCRVWRPDVVLMDIRMPNMNGVVATKRIKTEFPQTKVVVLTTFDDSDYILNAINHGASGYLLKDIGASALIDAVKNAYAGDTILPAKIARRIADAAKDVAADREIRLKRAFSLSERETEIALMMYDGFTNRQISAALKLSEGTARNYISAIYIKTGSDNRASFLRAAKEALG